MDQAQQYLSVRLGEVPFDGEEACGPRITPVAIAPARRTGGSRSVDRKYLINKLNYLNFQNRTVQLSFEHRRYGHTLCVEARPQPCQDTRVRCTWVAPRSARALSKYYAFTSFLVPDEQKLLRGTGQVAAMDKDGITLELPESCTEADSRRIVRHPCRGIHVELLCSGSRFKGTLVDFSPLAFRVRVRASPPQTFGWLSSTAPITVVLASGRETLFSGDCRVVSKTGGQRTREYVLEPLHDLIQRFEPKQYRSLRQELLPTPTVVFEHPLTKRLVTRKVLDLSGCGLAVEESARNAVLMPGLMIPRLDLYLASNLKLHCRAQVIHRQPLPSDCDADRIKCGLALLDMDIGDHLQLVGLLQQADDRRSYVSNLVDMDELWSFFFETGFIYPQKYGSIEKNRDRIKQIYGKLYTQNPSIARHFIHQDRGKIIGHMAMVRFYDNTWLIHHHAALGTGLYKAGLHVLDQIGRFITDSHRFSFMHMEYVICFYRPENRFPQRIFGGACQSIDDPRKCSEALFAYCHLASSGSAGKRKANRYSLGPADDEDLRELSSFCQSESAGLMLRALGLEPGDTDQSRVVEEFGKLGLKRERHVYALKATDRLVAIAMVNVADVGLNLSELTNCITLFVLEHKELSKESLNVALRTLVKKARQDDLPVLIYPEAAAESLQMPVEKRYVMWSLMPRFSDGFHRYTDAILRTGRRNGGIHDQRRSPPV